MPVNSKVKKRARSYKFDLRGYIRCSELKNRKKNYDLFSINILSKVYVQNFKYIDPSSRPRVTTSFIARYC